MAYRAFLGTDVADDVTDSPLESDRFGVRVGRLTIPGGAPHAAGDVLAIVDRSEADVVIVRYPADRVAWFAGLTGTGRGELAGRTRRLAIHADVLMYWSIPLEGRPLPELPDGWSARAARPADDDGGADTKLVDDLVEDLFRGYGNHYVANPLFDPELALAGYQEWARSSLRPDTGQAALVLDDGKEPVALATIDHDGTETEILLAGVVADRRGQGVYRHVLAAVEVEAQAQGAEELVISTQAHNAIVQRAWASYGLRPVLALETVHLVRSDLL